MRALHICLALLLSPAAAQAADSDQATERLVQFGLEVLRSGKPLSQSHDGGRSGVELRVLKTWKSTSGHYCRRFELRQLRQRRAISNNQHVRCRESGGGWRPVRTR